MISVADSTQGDYIMYTDASSENGNGGIAADPIDSHRKTPPGVLRADYAVRDTSILPLARELSDTLPIFGLELSAAFVAAPGFDSC